MSSRGVSSVLLTAAFILFSAFAVQGCGSSRRSNTGIPIFQNQPPSPPPPPPAQGPSITTNALPVGTNNQPYTATLSATGGQSPYQWVVVGTLPPGLRLNSDTGVISGTPTSNSNANITFQVTDAARNTARVTLNLTIL